MYTIWGRPDCVWCNEAKKLLEYHFIEYEYVELIPQNYSKFDELTNGARTVPQIFDPFSQLVGGYEDLRDFLKAQNYPVE